MMSMRIKKYTKLIQEFGSIEELWKAKKEKIKKVQGISENLAELISNEIIKKDVKRHLEFMEKNQIDIISIEDKEYPIILKEIYNPPINLYIRGNKEVLNMPALAIIGCRDATEYGKRVAYDFSYNISGEGYNIVSGLAKGIDSYAHLGAVESKQKTIAVLGNGLDTIYPIENKKLAQDILNSNGAIISEYPLGTLPDKKNFPLRNRIISGISKGILVVEAKEKSGTMITLDFALEQGRDVYAIPGNIDSKNSYGTNEVIKQGAKLVTNFQEIIEELYRENFKRGQAHSEVCLSHFRVCLSPSEVAYNKIRCIILNKREITHGNIRDYFSKLGTCNGRICSINMQRAINEKHKSKKDVNYSYIFWIFPNGNASNRVFIRCKFCRSTRKYRPLDCVYTSRSYRY